MPAKKTHDSSKLLQMASSYHQSEAGEGVSSIFGTIIQFNFPGCTFFLPTVVDAAYTPSYSIVLNKVQRSQLDHTLSRLRSSHNRENRLALTDNANKLTMAMVIIS